MNHETPTSCRAFVATAPAPGAVAIIQVHGPEISLLLERLTLRRHWPLNRLFLVDIAGIDQGLAVRLARKEAESAQLMLHGGPRVVQRVAEHLTHLGVTIVAPQDMDAQLRYPEAEDWLEALMLATMAKAQSPAAIDLLLAQPRLWRQAIGQQAHLSPSWDHPAVLADSLCLDRLIDPPMIALVGRPNIGKSTLTNLMLGRSASLVADHPGTTRDWVGGLALLQDVAVLWLDTPGMEDASHQSGSLHEIEQQAIDLAIAQARRADLLLAMRDPVNDWPDAALLGRRPDLWLMNKVDRLASAQPASGDGLGPNSPLLLSAIRQEGHHQLATRILQELGLADRSPRPWAFCPELKAPPPPLLPYPLHIPPSSPA